ncbi:MAG TPA: hypothetical protein VK177_13495 [Flavobacteriales bacterium]|nr:hypothetical protein [Flavobacteriales bacterium]
MSLKKTQQVFSGLNLIGNFIESPLRVGDIVFHDDGEHKVWGNIEDLVPGFTLADKLISSNKSDLKFTTESGIDISIGGMAGSPVASGEVQLKFNNKNSAFVSLKQIQRTVVKLGLVNAALTKIWEENGFNKLSKKMHYHFISDVITAESGTVIFSQDRDNKILLKGKNNAPIGSVLEIGSGQVELASSSKATLEIISATKISPLYTAMRYKSNGDFEVVG